MRKAANSSVDWLASGQRYLNRRDRSRMDTMQSLAHLAFREFRARRQAPRVERLFLSENSRLFLRSSRPIKTQVLHRSNESFSS